MEHLAAHWKIVCNHIPVNFEFAECAVMQEAIFSKQSLEVVSVYLEL